MHHVKLIIYVVWSTCLRAWWSLRGGRALSVMGSVYKVHPRTVFPTHRRLQLPKGDCRSEIVRYADFVQMHACCQYLAGLQHPTVIDVGAHHGAYAIVLGRMVKERQGKLIAIEPHPTSFEVLQQNVGMNGLEQTVAMEQVAISDTRCTVGLSLNDSESCLVNHGTAGSVEVPAERLADILERHGVSTVSLLIIDVEGAELQVLRSLQWDDVSIGRIFCEMHPYNWSSFGYGEDDFQRFLADRRLRCLDMYLMDRRSFHGHEYIGPCLLWHTDGMSDDHTQDAS